MLRLLATFAFLAFALPALADTLPDQVRSEAQRLQPMIAAASKTALAKPGAPPKPLDPHVVADLQKLAVNASQLSIRIDAGGGPTDLRCIFRGMAEETDVQLKAAAAAPTNTVQADALARISHMLDDAVLIAPAVKLSDAPPAKAGAIAACPAVRKF